MGIFRLVWHSEATLPGVNQRPRFWSVCCLFRNGRMLLVPAFDKGRCSRTWGWKAREHHPPVQFLVHFVRLQGKPVFLLDSFTKNIHDWRVMGVVLGTAVLKTKIWL